MTLSIITVNFNNKEGLKKTIQSVVNQKYDNFEYIVIDGASTDGSINVIEENKDKITYYVSEPDKGIYDAMNKGIKQAKGKYCLFLNSGDYFINKDTLTDIFNGQTYTEDLLIGRQKYVDRNGKITKSPYLRISELNMPYFISSTLPHQATFIKKELLLQCGMYNTDYRIVSDWIFWIEAIVKQKCSVKILPEYVSFMEKGGVSNDMSKCYNEMELYLSDCLRDGSLKWSDIFLCAKQSRNYIIARRNKFGNFIQSILVKFNKHIR